MVRPPTDTVAALTSLNCWAVNTTWASRPCSSESAAASGRSLRPDVNGLVTATTALPLALIETCVSRVSAGITVCTSSACSAAVGPLKSDRSEAPRAVSPSGRGREHRGQLLALEEEHLHGGRASAGSWWSG